MDTSFINEDGERIIPGTRRPDGTYRKEIRVRSGYVPQDEQPVYQSKGALAKQGVPRVPGMDESDLDAAKAAAAAKSKSAKKNDKRKQKKTKEIDDQSSAAVSAVAAQLDSVRLNGQAVPSASAATAEGAEQSEATPLEKKIRALRKKLKAAEALVAKRAAGEQLTGPEKEKVDKAAGWREEIRELGEEQG